jgi:TLC domain.
MLQYLRGGLGDCVFGFVYLMEFSTIFLSIRGILSRLKVSLCQISLAAVLGLLIRKGLSCCVNVSDQVITTLRHQWPGDASHILLLSCGHVSLCLLPVQSGCWTVILGGEELWSLCLDCLCMILPDP